jgi:hypothetical protein
MNVQNLRLLLRSSVLITLLASLAFADHTAVDYDHHANFARLHTYSWGEGPNSQFYLGRACEGRH